MVNRKAQQRMSELAMEAFDAMDKNDDGQVTICEFRDYCNGIKDLECIAEWGPVDVMIAFEKADCSVFQKLFNEVDTSDDCKITCNEIEDLLNKVPPGKIEEGHVTRLFHELDTSGNGTLDREEFRALLCGCGYPEDTIQNTIEQVAGSDGKVTLQEFLQAWEHDC